VPGQEEGGKGVQLRKGKRHGNSLEEKRGEKYVTSDKQAGRITNTRLQHGWRGGEKRGESQQGKIKKERTAAQKETNLGPRKTVIGGPQKKRKKEKGSEKKEKSRIANNESWKSP